MVRWAAKRGFLDVMGLAGNGLDKGMGRLARPIERPEGPAMATGDNISAFYISAHSGAMYLHLWYCTRAHAETWPDPNPVSRHKNNAPANPMASQGWNQVLQAA